MTGLLNINSYLKAGVEFEKDASHAAFVEMLERVREILNQTTAKPTAETSAHADLTDSLAATTKNIYSLALDGNSSETPEAASMARFLPTPSASEKSKPFKPTKMKTTKKTP